MLNPLSYNGFNNIFQFGGINVDVHITEGAVYISFSDFKEELAPALLINHTPYEITIAEKNTDVRYNNNNNTFSSLCCFIYTFVFFVRILQRPFLFPKRL